MLRLHAARWRLLQFRLYLSDAGGRTILVEVSAQSAADAYGPDHLIAGLNRYAAKQQIVSSAWTNHSIVRGTDFLSKAVFFRMLYR
jgi:hypothetical protein